MSNAPGALPRIPSPLYSLELATTHLVHDGMAADMVTGTPHGAHAVVNGLMEQARLPQRLKEPYDNWHMGGHFGEIGKTALVLGWERTPSPTVRREALHRSAVMMTVLGVADHVATEQGETRIPEATAAYFDGVKESLLDGAKHDRVVGGPAGQAQAYAYARTAGEWLAFGDDQKTTMGTLLDELKQTWLARMAESAPGRRNPEELLRLAEKIGGISTEIAAVAAVGHIGHSALRSLGAIGGIQEQSNLTPNGGLHTYASALVERHGVQQGAAAAQEMRQDAQLRAYQEGWQRLTTARQRRVFRTVTFFATSPWSHP